MCGLAGLINFESVDSSSLQVSIKGMTNALDHRGPDDMGIWIDAQASVALGHRRLAILDLSDAGHQPMHSKNDLLTLVFNGEIYNHLELRSRLEKHQNFSGTWLGSSDTETLLAAIECWGLEFALQQSVGMFALALWDKNDQKLFLARDRLGEKPLYYGWIENAFIFASELKSIKQHPSFNNDLNREAIKEFFRFNYVPAPLSIYQNIYKLEPGNILTSTPQELRDCSVTKAEYWSLSATVSTAKNDLIIDEKSGLDAVESQLKKSINQQMLSDVPLGAFLSGGIDSSLIVSLMQEQSTSKIKTFTIGFENTAFDESPYARKVAEHLGTEHSELIVTSKETMEVIPSLPHIYDEPFADSSQIPTYLVCKAAKKGVTVALSGDAGDEIFGGYNRYFWAPQIWQKISWLPYSSRKMLGKSLSLMPVRHWNKLGSGINFFKKGSDGISSLGDKVHKLSSRLENVDTLKDLYLSLVTEFQDINKIVIDNSPASINSQLVNFDSYLPDIQNMSPASLMMFCDTVSYLPDDILCKVDRAAMANSLETRAPFLDHRLIEIAWRLPENQKINKSHGKLPLRKILEKFVPNELIDRPKAGFGIPVGEWLRGPLRSWAEELLDHKKIQDAGYLHYEPIQKIWHQHLSGDYDWTPRIWSILMFQAWLEEQ
tara:strand:- start:1287 stop:3263 length:1977 start_codon:yes stop_codon:yes gene_type:complete